MGDFTDQEQKCSERWGKQFCRFFSSKGTSASKKSRNFGYGFPLDLLSKGQKTTPGGDLALFLEHRSSFYKPLHGDIFFYNVAIWK